MFPEVYEAYKLFCTVVLLTRTKVHAHSIVKRETKMGSCAQHNPPPLVAWSRGLCRTVCFEQQRTIWLPRNWLMAGIVVTSCLATFGLAVREGEQEKMFAAPFFLSLLWMVILPTARGAEDVLLDLGKEIIDDRAAVPLWPFALIGGLSSCSSLLIIGLAQHVLF